MVAVVTDGITLLDLVTTLPDGIEAGGDFTVVVEPVTPTERVSDVSVNVVFKFFVHVGYTLNYFVPNVNDFL